MQKDTQNIELFFFHWMGPVSNVIDEINELFLKENPNITIINESIISSKYTETLKVKLAAGDQPDIFGVLPGTPVKDFAQKGYLMDLSDEPYIDTIIEGALITSRGNDGKIYTIPTDMNIIAVTYNKKIFKDLNISIPTNWKDFLNLCEIIKKSGRIPIALGAKDQWITQLIPYAMAPSSIYSKNINFDQDMYEKREIFNNVEWNKVLNNYMELEKKGYFQANILNTNYEETILLMSEGKAAMVINGNWILPEILENSLDIELGMFPLPYVENGEDIWISSAVGGTLAIPSNAKHPEASKKYIEFWMRPEIAEFYLTEIKAFPVIKNLSVNFDPAIEDLKPFLKKGLTYPFLDQNWPEGVQDVFLAGLQELFINAVTVEELLEAMDNKWAAATIK